MPRIRIAFVAFIGYFASGTVRAVEFSWELSGLVSEAEAGPALETDVSALQATYFFDSVDDANGPYALASFFDPTSSVSVTITRSAGDMCSLGRGGTLAASTRIAISTIRGPCRCKW